jgi:SAM-dependent methyltransferase
MASDNSRLGALARALSRPRPFAPHDAPFWDDSHISPQMLRAHLDPTTDAASRRPETIRKTARHLFRSLELHAGDRILDLGCGPGLYATEFARRGVRVTGIDLSARSIAYATERAAADKLEIDYRVGDYTRDPLGSGYAAVLLIYLDFGVLDDAARDRLLRAVHGALAPGGAFAFDVHALRRRRQPDACLTVTKHDGGFWRPDPHLELTTTYRFGEDLDVTQHAIVERSRVTTYRVWDRAFSPAALRRMLGEQGFDLAAQWADLTGKPLRERSTTLAVVARKAATSDVVGGSSSRRGR